MRRIERMLRSKQVRWLLMAFQSAWVLCLVLGVEAVVAVEVAQVKHSRIEEVEEAAMEADIHTVAQVAAAVTMRGEVRGGREVGAGAEVEVATVIMGAAAVISPPGVLVPLLRPVQCSHRVMTPRVLAQDDSRGKLVSSRAPTGAALAGKTNVGLLRAQL